MISFEFRTGDVVGVGGDKCKACEVVGDGNATAIAADDDDDEDDDGVIVKELLVLALASIFDISAPR